MTPSKSCKQTENADIQSDHLDHDMSLCGRGVQKDDDDDDDDDDHITVIS